MKYKNASDILPDELLREVQKYVEGEALYIPKGQVRKKWGEGSGGRTFFLQRNEEIRYKFFHKVSIEELAEAYCLSYETIRKIVYK
jgi:Mor family transcriptional regulator